MSGEAISSPIVPPGPRGDVEMSQVGEDRIPAEKPDAELDNVFANEARGGISTTTGGARSKKLEARKKGSKAASILGMGGPSFGWRDITLPRIISMLFFGGGEYVAIPAFWALAGAAVFVFRMIKTDTKNIAITAYMAKIIYQLAMLTHVIGNFTFGWMLTRDHALDYYIRRCNNEGATAADMFSRLEITSTLSTFATIIVVILHTVVFSTSEVAVTVFEFFFGLIFFFPSLFITSIWIFIIWNKYRTARPYIVQGCDQESVVQGRAWAIISDTLEDMKVVSKYWYYGNYVRIATGVVYAGFTIFQFYGLYSQRSIEVYFDFNHETSGVYAFLLLIEFIIFYGSLFIPMVMTGWVNDKLISHVMDAIVRPFDFDYERGIRVKEQRLMETYRFQLLTQISVYREFIGFTFGNGAARASTGLTWGVTIMIVFFLFAVSANSITMTQTDAVQGHQ